jgi:hypothetical protein
LSKVVTAQSDRWFLPDDIKTGREKERGALCQSGGGDEDEDEDEEEKAQEE